MVVTRYSGKMNGVTSTALQAFVTHILYGNISKLRDNEYNSVVTQNDTRVTNYLNIHEPNYSMVLTKPEHKKFIDTYKRIKIFQN